nr:phage tail protein [Lacticaseibacillus casei]
MNQWRDYEATTQADLLQSALSDLKQYAVPVTNYTVDFAFIPENISIGDTIHVVDEKRNMYVSARVLELSCCYSLPSSSTATLGDYKIEADKVSAALKTAAKLAQATASTAQATATQAYSAANDAANNATAAQTAATSAQATANTAQTNAAAAQTTANTAQTTATNAAQVAEKAQTTANTARTFIKSATAPDTTNLLVNAVWITPATTDSNGNAVAASAKTWDGANWQDTPIESSLIADNIVGKTITGSTFANTNGTFSIDKDGNIIGSKITGSEVELSTVDTPGLTKTGMLFTGGLLFDSNYKNVTIDTNIVQNETAIDWYGPRVIAGYKNGSSATAGINAGSGASRAFAPQLYATRTNSNGQLTGYTALSPDGITVETFDSSANNTGMGTVTPDQIIQLSNVGTLAWSGILYPQGGDTATMSIPLSNTQTGWLIRWSYYNSSKIQNTYYNYTLLPKVAVDAQSKNMIVTLSMPGVGMFFKHLWYSDTNIAGDAMNNQGMQAPHAVMDAVYAV